MQPDDISKTRDGGPRHYLAPFARSVTGRLCYRLTFSASGVSLPILA
jgi:hypothetical protein